MFKALLISITLLFSITLYAQKITYIKQGSLVSQFAGDQETVYNKLDFKFTISENQFQFDIEDKRDRSLDKHFNTNKYQIKKKTESYILGIIDSNSMFEYMIYDIKNNELYCFNASHSSSRTRFMGHNRHKLTVYSNQINKKLKLGYLPNEIIQVLINEIEMEL